MTDRLAQFQEKHPDRAARWDRIIAPLLGMRPSQVTPDSLARKTLDDVQGRLLAAVYGEAEPTVPTATATVP